MFGEYEYGACFMIIGFTCGAFDLLHAGHVYFLEQSAKQCDYLKVGLHSNPRIDRFSKNAPIQTIYERWMQLRAVREVSEIIPYDTEDDLVNLFATQTIHKRFLGTEYKGCTITGENICQLKDIEIVHIPRLHTYSSSELRERIIATIVNQVNSI